MPDTKGVMERPLRSRRMMTLLGTVNNGGCRG